MENIETLEAALKRIAELERENEKLREELEYYKNRKMTDARSTMPSGWQSTMILLLVMKVE